MPGEDEKCMQNIGCKTSRERLLGRPGCKWKDNIRIDLREIGWEDV
jgi:hypothetical protein